MLLEMLTRDFDRVVYLYVTEVSLVLSDAYPQLYMCDCLSVHWSVGLLRLYLHPEVHAHICSNQLVLVVVVFGEGIGNGGDCSCCSC